VYSTCLFCNQSLGANEVVESFPVGRRLAFDQRLGRLWVVCRKCAKWNLTPLEERWEAIETCERLFRETRTRMSTDQIGLARLPEGLELVRIGEPQRPEFAAWRYGDVFTRRKKQADIAANVSGILGFGAGITQIATSVFGIGLGVVGWSLISVNLVSNVVSIRQQRRRRRIILGRGRSGSGHQWTVRGEDAQTLKVVPSSSTDGWALEVLASSEGRNKRRMTFEGEEARRLAAKAVPHLTYMGGSEVDVRAAVALLDEKGRADNVLQWMAANPTRWRSGTVVATIGNQGAHSLLAVEMALNEENERRALEGELALLEDAWQEAEEIAAISDKLALPEGVEARLSALKGPNNEGKT
jgi:hypothetical protein